jgi:hypothetical protein
MNKKFVYQVGNNKKSYNLYVSYNKQRIVFLHGIDQIVSWYKHAVFCVSKRRLSL